MHLGCNQIRSLDDGVLAALTNLGELCAALTRRDCRFETRVLRSGDYPFVVADGPPACRERLLPRIIERKSAGDVPSSLKPGGGAMRGKPPR